MVEVGQVYRDKDKRTVRYIRVDSMTTKYGQPAAWCLPSTISGRLLDNGRGTRIRVANFEKRFELVGPSATA